MGIIGEPNTVVMIGPMAKTTMAGSTAVTAVNWSIPTRMMIRAPSAIVTCT